jgi:hypothetical protein
VRFMGEMWDGSQEHALDRILAAVLDAKTPLGVG